MGQKVTKLKKKATLATQETRQPRESIDFFPVRCSLIQTISLAVVSILSHIGLRLVSYFASNVWSWSPYLGWDIGSAPPSYLSPLAIKYRLLDISPFDFPTFSSENNNLFPKDQTGLQLLLTTCPLPGNETQGPLLQKPKQNTFSPLEQIYRWQPQIINLGRSEY